MQRLVFALLIGVGLALVFSGPAAGQPDKDKEKPAKVEGAKDHPVVVKITQTWYDWERVSTMVGLVFLAMVLFQLIMLRGSMERLNEKMGAES